MTEDKDLEALQSCLSEVEEMKKLSGQVNSIDTRVRSVLRELADYRSALTVISEMADLKSASIATRVLGKYPY